MPSESDGKKPLPIGVIAIILTVVIANLGNNIVAPVMPALRTYFNSTAAEVGLVASGFGLGRLVMDMPAGYLTDRISANRLFTLGILISAGAASLAAASSTLQQLILFRTLMGFGSAIVSTVALVLLVNIARPDQRGEVLAYYTSSLLFGQAISPAIGGYLASLFDWRAAFIFCALTPLLSLPLNLIGSARTAEARRSGREREQAGAGKGSRRPGDSPTNWPALGAVYFTTFVNFFNRQGMRQALLPLYGGMVLAMDPGAIGLILTIGSIATILINLPSGAVADRIGRKLLLIPGMLVIVVGNMTLLVGDTQLFFIIGTVLISMGVLANSMQSGLVADLIPERLVGQGMGMYRFTADLGIVVGPFLMGLVVDGRGFAAAATMGAAAILVGVILAVALIPRRTLAVAGAGSRR